MMDSISIELEVQAVGSDGDFWMQGDLVIAINGELPYGHSDIVDAQAVFESMQSDGNYPVFSCCCGIPDCSNWGDGIEVTHGRSELRWASKDRSIEWCVDRQQAIEDLEQVRRDVASFKQFFAEKNIEYVGVGYSW